MRPRRRCARAATPPAVAGRASSSGSTTARSPNSRNLLSGAARQRELRAGTTTAAPWSPPMASSAIRTFWGMEREYRVARRKEQQGRSRPSAPSPPGPFLSAARAANGARRASSWLRRLEHGTGLARIGIDPKDAETPPRWHRGRPYRRPTFRGCRSLRSLPRQDRPATRPSRAHRRDRRPPQSRSRPVRASPRRSARPVAETRPATRSPPCPRGVASNAACRRGSARNFASLAIAPRACSSAERSKCRPVSATSARVTGTLHGRSDTRSGLVIRSIPTVITRHPALDRSRHLPRIGKRSSPRPKASPSCAGKFVYRPSHVGGETVRTVAGGRENIARSAPAKAGRPRGPQAPPHRPPAGRRTPPRFRAFSGEPPSPPPPFRAGSRPCPGRTRQTAPGRGYGPRPAPLLVGARAR